MKFTSILRLGLCAASALILGACASEPKTSTTTTTHETTVEPVAPVPPTTQSTSTTTTAIPR